MYVYESSATGRFPRALLYEEVFYPLHGVSASERFAVCQKNNRKSSIKHDVMNTCASCVVCVRDCSFCCVEDEQL